MTFKGLAELTVESLLADLEKWRTQLPPQMQLANMNAANLSIGLRRTIYYAHLLHLGAIMLIYRLLAYRAQRLSIINQPRDDASNIRLHKFASRGVQAAQHSAEILSQLMCDLGVFRRCWLVM
jgi:hypothetical protein